MPKSLMHLQDPIELLIAILKKGKIDNDDYFSFSQLLTETEELVNLGMPLLKIEKIKEYTKENLFHLDKIKTDIMVLQKRN